MGSLSQGIFEKGYKMGKEQAMKEMREKEIEIGREIGIAISLRNIMKNLEMTEEQAMTALCIPQDEQEKYKSLLRDCEEIQL